ncbi:MAG: hypothetical protein F6J93_14255 [Oscillatoria sp. SIO1A7]|nr:hypothetical protein [Oscillatoria sp. SIO1A7]
MGIGVWGVGCRELIISPLSSPSPLSSLSSPTPYRHTLHPTPYTPIPNAQWAGVAPNAQFPRLFIYLCQAAINGGN